jgi:hypothetical protein
MKPDSPQWIAAKAEGDRAELEIARWFRRRGWETFKTLGRVEFDLLLQCQVEVKRDLKAESTGNVAIETAYRGQPSGILTSKATWWVIVVDSRAIMVKKDDLLRFVLAERFPEVPAGDGKASMVSLVPVERLTELKGVHLVNLTEAVAPNT